jgi:nucleotide-binding universal stress UspA family protein
MSDEPASGSEMQGAEPASSKPAAEPQGNPRTFLVVVDDTPEMQLALHYACRRALFTHARVALLHVIASGEVQQWAAVEEMIRDEKRAEAEQMMHKLARQVQDRTGQMAVLHVREGSAREELLKLIDEEEDISILVLAAASGGEGPGPLVTYLMEKGMSKLRVPVVIVPGGLDIDAIDHLT